VRTVEFSRYGYVPSILADQVGQVAYEKLAPRTKAGILPLFELCWHPRATDFQHSLAVVRSMGREHPFILDIDKRPPPQPYISRHPRDPKKDGLRVRNEEAAKRAFEAELARLLRPSDGFVQWRTLVSHFPNTVPVLQVTNPSAQRVDVLRQTELFCADGASAAFRITRDRTEEACELAAEVLMHVNSPRQLLVILDCGQGRSQLPRRSGFVADALLSIQKRVGLSRANLICAVCMSNSFNRPSMKGMRFKENYDRQIWRRVCAGIPLAFGDYAASERGPHAPYRPPGWLPTITHALPGGWLISRHPNRNDPAGWVAGCKNIKADFRFSPIESWCDQAIDETAISDSPALDRQQLWHAARMNGHIERQFADGGIGIKKAA
jgi:T4 beta protein